jgi:hypothetical protein
LFGLAAVLLLAASAHPQDDTPTLKDFQQRIDKYMLLRKRQHVRVSASNSADQLAEQKQQAAEKMQTARPVARQGDIFTPAIAAYFKKQIAATMQGAEGAKIRASLQHAEPLPTIHLAVNAKYPKELPLQSTPPTLLMNLPPLPKDMQYRVVGSTLVLYDSTTDLVVDLILNAIA